jgi:hypothetical protein
MPGVCFLGSKKKKKKIQKEKGNTCTLFNYFYSEKSSKRAK